MSKSIVRLACGLLIMLVVIGGLAGCSKLPEPDYADQITESTLQAMNDVDYAAFTHYFTPESRAAFSEDEFETNCQSIKAAFGDYIDKEYWKTQTEDGYIGVHYTANFSGTDEEIIISAYFEEIDGETYIIGFWVKSPTSGGQ
jgi:hypothetical protein